MTTWQGDDFSIVCLPDTQRYSEKNPAIFEAQTQWIIDNRVSENIQMVLHFGDVVENGGIGNSTEWTAARNAMDTLGSTIPYLVAIGNHDYDVENLGNVGNRASTIFNTHFGQADYIPNGWWLGGFFEAGKAENSYLLRTISNRDYIFLNLEFYPRQSVVNWARSILETYADRDCVLMTHAYLFHDNTRIDDDILPQWGPTAYGLNDNDGRDLWRSLISQHKNIILVVCGHVHGDGTGQLTSYGTKINGYRYSTHQILSNYQEPIRSPQDTEGGQLRIYKVRPSLGTIEATTYSTWLSQWLTDNQNQFTLSYQDFFMAAPSETYVDPAIAADSGTGTSGDPYGDLQYALDTMTRDATNGDRINIKAGTDENMGTEGAAISLATYGTPTSSAPLILQGYTTTAGDGGIGGISGGGTVAVWSDTVNDFCYFIDLHMHNCGSATVIEADNQCHFYNCEIDNTTGSGMLLDNNCTITGCYIHNTGGTGLEVQVGSAILNCHFENGTNDFTTALSLQGNGCQVIGNVFDLDGATDAITHNSIRYGQLIINNSIYSNGGTGTGIEITGVEGHVVVNNIIEGFSGVGGVGLSIASGADPFIIGFNAFYNNTTNESISGDVRLDLANDQSLGASPFTNAGSDDFTVGTSVKALGYPIENYTGLSVRTYKDIGALQREEAGAAGGAGGSGGIRLGHVKV